MPHQCLNCGETFAEGSSDLLEGCPSCEGTRFFYTDEPLEADEREELREETDDDVESMLQDIVEDGDRPDLGEDIWSREAWEEWIRLKASDDGDGTAELADDDSEVSFDEIAEAVGGEADLETEAPEPETLEAAGEAAEAEPVQVELGDVEETAPPGSEEEPEPAEEAAVHEALQPAPQPDDDGRPSTLNINDPGEYEIDVRRLLEDSPVIVERDGSFVIHLPSVFEREQ